MVGQIPSWIRALFPTFTNGAGTGFPVHGTVKLRGPTISDDPTNDQTIIDFNAGQQKLVSGVTWNVDSGTAPDTLIDFDTSVANSKAKLPVPTAGRVLWFTDKTGNASVNNATIIPNGSEQINGVAGNFVLSTNRGTVRVESDGTNWFATLATPTAGGASTPTGTGLTHNAAGAQDAASYRGTADQVLTTNNAATDTAWATVAGDLAPSTTPGTWYTVSLTGSGGAGASVSLGNAATFGLQFSAVVTAPTISHAISTTGAGVALTNTAQAAKVGSAAAGGNYITSGGNGDGAGANGYHQVNAAGVGQVWLGKNASLGAVIYLGSGLTPSTSNHFGLSDGANAILNAISGNVDLCVGGTPYFLFGASAAQFSQPQIGYSSAWGSLNAVGTQAMADANQTPGAAVYSCATIKTTGALTANRNLTVPSATDAQGYEKALDNQCTGGFGIVVTTGAGSTITIANGKVARFRVDSTGVKRVTADNVNT